MMPAFVEDPSGLVSTEFDHQKADTAWIFAQFSPESEFPSNPCPVECPELFRRFDTPKSLRRIFFGAHEERKSGRNFFWGENWSL